MIRKLNNIFEFFKSTLVINLVVCAVAVLFGGFDYFFVYFLSFGFFMSIGFKELYRKNEYLFYTNNGLTKIQMLIFSYLLTCCVTIVIGLIIFLTKTLF
ncbi:hypothetical protein C8C83_2239 [Flavobacterium sp. 90]|nr:hypothetical protein C8C82_2543 [Flavobacterium sp. 81]TCK54346.1 hypothetical protein C8C83_2239 [Flavobacterium sp. 90]